MAYVRDHTAGQVKNALSATVAGSLAANIPADNVLLAAVGFDNQSATTPTVLNLSKPVGELEDWVKLGHVDAPAGGSLASVRVELWGIKTSVQWASGTSITATLSANTTAKCIALGEHDNTVSLTEVSTEGTNGSTGGTPAAATSGAAPGENSVIVGAAAFENIFNNVTRDSDSTNGAWSAANGIGTTGSTNISNASVLMQYKYPTASGHQTFNPTASANDGVALIVALEVASAPTQTIIPSAIAPTTQFGSPTMVPGAVNVTPSSISNPAQFGTPALVPGEVTVSPSGIAPTVQFGTPTAVPGAVTVSPSGVAGTTAFGSPTVQPGQVSVLPSGFQNLASFGSPTLVPGAVSVEPTSIVNPITIGTPTVEHGAVSLEVSGFNNPANFGSPTVVPGEVVVNTAGFASQASFGTPTITPGQVIVEPTGFTETAQFGTPDVVPGEVIVTPDPIAPSTTFGSPTIDMGTWLIQTEAIDPTTAFGTPEVLNTQQVIFVEGIAPSAQFGVPELIPGSVIIIPDAFTSLAGFGTPEILTGDQPALLLEPVGIGSTLVFGSPAVVLGQRIDISLAESEWRASLLPTDWRTQLTEE